MCMSLGVHEGQNLKHIMKVHELGSASCGEFVCC